MGGVERCLRIGVQAGGIEVLRCGSVPGSPDGVRAGVGALLVRRKLLGRAETWRRARARPGDELQLRYPPDAS